MVIYGFVWRGICCLLGAVGVPLAWIAVPLDAMVAIIVLAIVVGATTAVGHWSVVSAAQPSPGPARSTVLGFAAWTAVVAIAGFAVLLGVGVAGLVLLLAATSPQLLRWCTRRPQDTPSANIKTETSTGELCRQWQESYDALRRATSPAARLRIVEARQRCLDELERRDPDGLNAWLASNASAAGDPSRFLAGNGPDHVDGSA